MSKNVICLALLKEIVPKVSRVAVLGASTEPDYTQVVRETELAAGALARADKVIK